MEPGQQWIIWLFFLFAGIVFGLGALAKWAVATAVKKLNKKLGIKTKETQK